MPEDIKKVVVLCFSLPAAERVFAEARARNLPGLKRFLEEGAWAENLSFPAEEAAFLATLATGASPESHGVLKVNDPCRAEYLWEAGQRSSKQFLQLGVPADRPAKSIPAPGDSASLAAFLRTSPDWDLCFLHFGPSAPGAFGQDISALDKTIGDLWGATEEDTLRLFLGSPKGSSRGSMALAGPGVKKGYELRMQVHLQDVVPTVCYLAEISVPSGCEGGVLYQALEDPDLKIKELRACRRNYERLRRSSGRSAMC
jgi:hypothetical protein